MSDGEPLLRTDAITFNLAPSEQDQAVLGGQLPSAISDFDDPLATASVESDKEKEESKPIKFRKPGKNVIAEKDIDKTIKDVQQLLKLLQDQKEVKKEKELIIEKNKLQDIKEIKPFDIKLGKTSLVLPIPGTVPNPLIYGTNGKNYQVHVGTKDWHHTLDMMRAQGWPTEGNLGIKDFLKRSADVVERDLHFDVWAKIPDPSNPKTQRKINMVEWFCNWFPDFTRQDERLAVNWAKLHKAIREQNPGARLPSNYTDLKTGKSEQACPPKPFDFQYIDKKGQRKVAKNFLRHMTFWDKSQPTFALYGTTGLKEVFECGPKPGEERSWIDPVDVKDVEEAFDLQEFRYMYPDKFNQYLYNLTAPFGKDDSTIVRQMDKDGKAYISVQFPDGGAYKVWYAQIPLAYPVCAKKEDKGVSLREWCELLCRGGTQDKESSCTMSENLNGELYPLIHVILNVHPPKSDAINGIPDALKRHIYSAKVSGSIVRRMYADAPLSVFQKQMIKQYGQGMLQTDSHDECLEKFIENVWKVCKSRNLFKFKDDSVPTRYREILTRLFEYGGHTGCSIEEIKMEASTDTTDSVQNPKDIEKKTKMINLQSFAKDPDEVKRIIGKNFIKYVQTKVIPIVGSV